MWATLQRSFFKNTSTALFATALLSIAVILIGFYFELYAVCFIPVIVVCGYLAVYNFSWVYFLMLASLPVCTELYFGNLATDMPTEPLMALVMVLGGLYFLSQKNNGDSKKYFLHPFIQFILFQFIWYIVVMIYSTVPLISFKYVLAKTWYIAAFVFVTPLVITDSKKFKLAFWCVFYPQLFTIIYILIKHAASGFAFETVNHVPAPFYKNHVDYACLLSIMFPLLFVATTWYKPGDLKRILLNVAKVIFAFAIFVSYTRTAWLAVGIAFGFYFIYKFKLIKPTLIIGGIAAFLFISFLTFENRFLRFAPDFKKTIYHHNLSDHLTSTKTLNDVSSAERLYRWVAAAEMVKARPVFGFGQGGFVANYKNYAVSLFTTYVSGNFEHSTVHNYLLFILTEQGIIGLLLFLSMIVFVLIAGQRIYLQTKDETEKTIVLGVLVVFVVILFDNMLSDLIEAVKVGTFFYWCIALLVIQDLRNQKRIATHD